MTSLCRDSCLSCLTMRHSTLASGYRPHSSLFASFRLIASDNKSWASTSGSPVAPVDSWESMARIFSLAVNVTTQSMTVVLLNVFEHLACLWTSYTQRWGWPSTNTGSTSSILPPVAQMSTRTSAISNLANNQSARIEEHTRTENIWEWSIVNL